MNRYEARLIRFARNMRHRLTPSEKAFKKLLDLHNLHGEYLMQYVVGPFIADFYIPKMRLIVEIDGSFHQAKFKAEKDDRRDAYMRNRGLDVIRIQNSAVRSKGAELVGDISARIHTERARLDFLKTHYSAEEQMEVS